MTIATREPIRFAHTGDEPDLRGAQIWFAAIPMSSIPVTGFGLSELTTVCVFPGAGPLASSWIDVTTDGQNAIDAALPSNNASVGSMIRSIKDRSGLTWSQLAQWFGVSRRAVHGWAAGARTNARHAELVIELADILDGRGDEADPAAIRSGLLATMKRGTQRASSGALDERRGRFLERLGSPSRDLPWRDTAGDVIETFDAR